MIVVVALALVLVACVCALLASEPFQGASTSFDSMMRAPGAGPFHTAVAPAGGGVTARYRPSVAARAGTAAIANANANAPRPGSPHLRTLVVEPSRRRSRK